MKNRIERSALVPYQAEQMFELVNDIESYPDFMDGCVEASVLERGADWLEARLVLSKAGIRQAFVTRNQLQPPTRMTMSLVEGPFTQLEGVWQFTPLGEQGCKVSFELEFTLRNALLGMALGKLLQSVTSHQVEALCARARQVYGAATIFPEAR